MQPNMHLKRTPLLKRYALLAALLLLALPYFGAPALAQEPGTTLTGEVVAVRDERATEVLRNGAAVAVRLRGIDAPEMGQPFGRASKQAASKAGLRESRLRRGR